MRGNLKILRLSLACTHPGSQNQLISSSYRDNSSPKYITTKFLNLLSINKGWSPSVNISQAWTQHPQCIIPGNVEAEVGSGSRVYLSKVHLTNPNQKYESIFPLVSGITF